MAGDALDVTGTVVGLLPRGLYRVRLDDQRFVLAHVADSVRKNFVRVLVGDTVLVQLSPNDRTRGRIARRLAASGS